MNVAVSESGKAGVDGLERSSSDSEARAPEDKIQADQSAKAITGSIGHLPAEILMQIFSHIHPTSPARAGSVILVCRYWNAVALRTYTFWRDLAENPWSLNNISIRAYPERLAALEFAIAHAGQLTFDLDLVGMGEPLSVLLAGHRPRISSIKLSVVVPRELKFLHALVDAEMPKLESLVVKQHRGPEHRIQAEQLPYPHLHECFQPHLLTLQLPCWHFSITSPLRSLQHLTLTRCSWVGCDCERATFDSLIVVLGQCPNLETLFLDSCIPVDGPVTRRACLQALQRLTIDDYADFIVDVLAQLDIPHTTMLDFRNPEEINGIISTIFQLRSAFFAAWAAADCLHLRIRESPSTTMLLKTRVEGALRLCYSCHESQFDYDDFFRRLAAMLEEATVPSLTTLVIDIWTDSHPTPPGLSFLWSLPARLATLGVLGLDGRGLLLPFMASADGKQALQSLKRLYLTWDASLPAPMPAHYQDPTQPHATIERSPDAASTGDSNAVTGAPPPRAPDAVPYGPQACEAFCDVLAPVLTMQPYTGSLEILHVLLVKPASKSSRKDAPAVDLGAVQEQLSGRLGHLVRVGVCWYDPEEDYESAVGVS